MCVTRYGDVFRRPFSCFPFFFGQLKQQILLFCFVAISLCRVKLSDGLVCWGGSIW